MINLSELAVIGVLEAYLILALGLVVFIILNHKLRLRVKTLTSWLDQLKVKTAELLAERSPDDAPRYLDYLENESSLTKKRFEEKHPDKPLTFNSGNSPDENLVTLRHLFLDAEMKASAVSDESEKWAQLNQSLEPIISHLGTDPVPFDKEVSTSDLSSKWQELCEAAIYTFESNNNEARDAFINLLQIINNELGFDEINIPDFLEGEAEESDQPQAAEVLTEPEAPEQEQPEFTTEIPEDPEFAETIQLSDPVELSSGESPSSPEAIERHNHRIDVEKLKEMTNRQQELIESLQKENENANSTISLKATELDQLTAFFNDASDCVERLESELEAAVSRTIEMEDRR